jgi:tetratricopeptide (TPR) repeat protein
MSMHYQFEETVKGFVEKDGGIFFTLTNDTTFLTNLRATLYKHLQLKGDIVRNYSDTTTAMKDCKELTAKKTKIIFLIEREFRGQSNIEFIKFLKLDFPDVLVVILTTEIEREKLILLHELGASNYIIKPISVNTLLEKLATTIRPQTKIGQYIDKGKRLIFHGEFEKALKLANKVLEAKDDSAAGLMLKGDALKHLGRRKEAARAYLQASKAAKLYLEPIKKLVDFFKEENDPEEQLKYLQQLDKLSPLNVERKIDIGGLHMQMGNEEHAQKTFDEAVHLTHRQVAGMLSNVNKYIAEQCMSISPELAERYLRQSLDAKRHMLSKSDVETFNTLGLALRRQGKWQEAITEYEKAEEVAPQDENVLYNKALAFMDGKQPAKAKLALDKCLKINPHFADQLDTISYNIGTIYLINKEPQRAIGFFQNAMKLNPENEDARAMVNKIMEKQQME